MKRAFLTVFFLIFAAAAWAASVETVVVGRCTMEVIIMQSGQEHAKGMLGYTERTFPYAGMLFEMNSKGRKVFHTMGMQMPIRILGVTKLSSGNYKVIGSAVQALPGMDAIYIDAPDVLEIPEGKFQLHYKKCLGAL